MSEEKFDFGSMVSAQMKTFRPGFKFPGSFNDLKSVESDPTKRKAAIKAGREYATEHIKWIVDKLMAIPDITVCPHGRPIAYKLTKRELDRQFDRIK